MRLNNSFKKILKIIVVVIIIFTIIFLSLYISIIREVLYLLLFSFIISYTLKPLHKKLIKNKFNSKSAAVLLIFLIIAIIVFILLFIIPSLFKESLDTNSLVQEVQSISEMFYSRIKPIKNNKIIYQIVENFNAKLESQIVLIFTKFFNSILKLGENILAVAVIPVIAYYFLSCGDTIGNRLLLIFPVKMRNEIKKICFDIDRELGRYILSQFLLCIIIGIITFFILIGYKVDFPVILTLLNAFFNIIPYFGPIFGALPAIIVAYIKSPETALWILVWFIILQQIEGNIIAPSITGDSVNMHPLMVIILVIVGGKVGGFMGMVLAVPLGVILKVIFEDLSYYLF
jgi:predicted PurR-regulated permease PerM